MYFRGGCCLSSRHILARGHDLEINLQSLFQPVRLPQEPHMPSGVASSEQPRACCLLRSDYEPCLTRGEAVRKKAKFKIKYLEPALGGGQEGNFKIHDPCHHHQPSPHQESAIQVQGRHLQTNAILLLPSDHLPQVPAPLPSCYHKL